MGFYYRKSVNLNYNVVIGEIFGIFAPEVKWKCSQKT